MDLQLFTTASKFWRLSRKWRNEYNTNRSTSVLGRGKRCSPHYPSGKSILRKMAADSWSCFYCAAEFITIRGFGTACYGNVILGIEPCFLWIQPANDCAIHDSGKMTFGFRFLERWAQEDETFTSPVEWWESTRTDTFCSLQTIILTCLLRGRNYIIRWM